MGKGPRAPWGFQCPYRDGCPHLEGMSTQWMWARHQEDIWETHDLRGKVEYLEKACWEQEQLILRQCKEMAALKEQVRAMHRRQFAGQDHGSCDASPPDTKERKTESKKRGAPQGHPPWTRRQPGHVDRTVGVEAPSRCPRCGCRGLLPLQERVQHLQEDIVLCPRTEVTRFNHHQAWCPVCERSVIASGPGEQVGSYIGPVAKSAAVYLHLGIGISVRNVQKIMTQMFGLTMVPASVLGFEKAACARSQDLYLDLHEKILASAYLHADETSWPVNGQSWWLWYAGHEQLAYFHVDPHRSSQAAQAVLGGFEGVLNTDDYASYNAVGARARQSCLAHPLRATREALERIADLKATVAAVDPRSQRFVQKARTFLKEACELGRKLRARPLASPKAGCLKANLLRRLQWMCTWALPWEPAEQLRNRLKKQGNHLLTFIEHPEVEPTNNQAEQSLRRSVITRKVTFGNRSEAGARRHAQLSSLILTAQRQGRDPRAALQCLWTSSPASARAAFYRVSTPPKSKRRSKQRAPFQAGKVRDPPAPIASVKSS